MASFSLFRVFFSFHLSKAPIKKLPANDPESNVAIMTPRARLCNMKPDSPKIIINNRFEPLDTKIHSIIEFM